MPTNTPKGDRKRTNFRLPQALHKAIKVEAAQSDREMTEIIVEQLSTRYPELAQRPTDHEPKGSVAHTNGQG